MVDFTENHMKRKESRYLPRSIPAEFAVFNIDIFLASELTPITLSVINAMDTVGKQASKKPVAAARMRSTVILRAIP